MDEENEKLSLFDISQYSERTRRIIFGVLAVVLVSIVAIAMFIISPQNEKTLAAVDEPRASSTAAAVDDETGSVATPTAEATEPVENYNGTFPKDEAEEQALAQKKIIEKGLEEQKALIGKEISDVHEEIPNAEQLRTLASKGMLEYCTDIADETTEQKQERMKPYFHEDNSDYQSPQSLFFLRNCSVEDTTEVMHDETETKLLVYVGVAWASQYDKDGKATTGYTQYRVEVDKDGIVSFDD